MSDSHPDSESSSWDKNFDDFEADASQWIQPFEEQPKAPDLPAASPSPENQGSPLFRITKTSQATQPDENTSSNSWGGWGSWISSAVSSVATAIEQTEVPSSLGAAANTMASTIKTTTQFSFDKLYETLDPEYAVYDKKSEPQEITDKPPAIHTTPTASTESQEQPQSPIHQVTKTAANAAEAFFSTIDKTFDFASYAIGTTLVTGIKTVQRAGVGEKLSEIGKKMEESGVIHQGYQVGGQVLNTSLNALETLGAKAMGTIAQSSILPEELNTSQSWQKPSSSTENSAKGSLHRVPVDSFSLFFENNAGNANLQAIEMLSSEAKIQIASCATLPEEIQNAFDVILDTLDVDNLIDGLETICEEEVYSEAFKSEFCECLEGLQIESGKHVNQLAQLRDSFSEDMNILIQDSSGVSVQHVYKLFLHYMADTTAKYCELMRRLSEALIIQAAQNVPCTLTPSTLRPLCDVLRQFALHVVFALHQASETSSQSLETPSIMCDSEDQRAELKDMIESTDVDAAVVHVQEVLTSIGYLLQVFLIKSHKRDQKTCVAPVIESTTSVSEQPSNPPSLVKEHTASPAAISYYPSDSIKMKKRD